MPLFFLSFMTFSNLKSSVVSFGLTQKHLEFLRTLFLAYPEIEAVVLFGSRAKGSHKIGSDVDLLLKGEGVTVGTLARLGAAIEDSSFPYFVDLVSENTLTSKELQEHIRQFGVEIYSRV